MQLSWKLFWSEVQISFSAKREKLPTEHETHEMYLFVHNILRLIHWSKVDHSLFIHTTRDIDEKDEKEKKMGW